eukprot:85483-Rhodomonas_salina.6
MEFEHRACTRRNGVADPDLKDGGADPSGRLAVSRVGMCVKGQWHVTVVQARVVPVSYTHLTLPTICSV